MEVWPIPVRPRKITTDLIVIKHIVVGVVALSEVSLTTIGIEGRSRGLVVVETLLSVPSTLATITHHYYTLGVVPIAIIAHDRGPF